MNIYRNMLDYEGDEAVIITADDGKRYRVTLENDLDSSPTEFECYDEDDLDSWRCDGWHYVGVIVTPLDVPESKQFELSDSLWGVEFDFPLNPPQTIDGHTYRYTDMDYACMVHPVPDIIETVIANVKEYDTQIAIQNYCFS